MKTFSRILPVVVLLAALSPESIHAQNGPAIPPGMPASRPRLINSAESQPEKKTLSANYTITISVLNNDKSVGEATVLTAARQIMTNVPVTSKDSDVEGMVSLSGYLAENDAGGLTFDYQLEFQLSSPDAKAPNPNVPVSGNSMGHRHSNQSQGSVIAKPGKPYDLLKAGGCTFRVVIDKAKE